MPRCDPNRYFHSSQSGPKSNGYEGVLHTHVIPRSTPFFCMKTLGFLQEIQATYLSTGQVYDVVNMTMHMKLFVLDVAFVDLLVVQYIYCTSPLKEFRFFTTKTTIKNGFVN